MRVAFRSSLEDLTEANLFMAARNRPPRSEYVKIYAGVSVLVVFALACIFDHIAFEGLGWFVLGLSSCLVIMALSARAVQTNAVRKLIARRYAELDWEPHTLEIADAGVVVDSGRSSITLRWPNITGIEESDVYIRFLGEFDSIAQLPSRVFRTEEEKRLFLEEAGRIWRARRSDARPVFPETSGIMDLQGPST